MLCLPAPATIAIRFPAVLARMVAMSRPWQDGSPQMCPECGEDVGSVALETHLRQRHHLYQFRGQRRSFNDTLAFLLQTLCTTPGDPEAWQLLASFVREHHGTRAVLLLAA